MKKRYVIIGLCLLLVLCISMISRSSREAPPPDISDLTLATLELPDAENAFTSFMAAAAHMSDDTRAAVDMYLADDETKRDGYSEILASNARIVDAVQQGLRREHYVGRAMTNITDTAEHIMDLRALARHLCAAAGLERSAGRYSEAAESLVAALGMTERLTRRPESIIELLVGLAGTSTALNDALDLARTPGIPDSVLENLAAAIASHDGAAEAGLIRASKCEFRMTHNLIREMKSGGLGAKNAALFGGLPVPKPLRSGRIPNHLLSSSGTVLMFAELYRGIIATAETNSIDMDLSFQATLAARLSPVGPMDFLKPNAVGRILLGLMAPAGEQFVHRRVAATARVRSAGAIVALHRYRLATGALPTTLEDVVPSYLPAVPIDPYDGQAIRYRPDADLIYVLGKDLRDDGGSLALTEDAGMHDREDRASRRDICWGITQPLDFSATLDVEQP